jgi:hypothetical protein
VHLYASARLSSPGTSPDENQKPLKYERASVRLERPRLTVVKFGNRTATTAMALVPTSQIQNHHLPSNTLLRATVVHPSDQRFLSLTNAIFDC